MIADTHPNESMSFSRRNNGTTTGGSLPVYENSMLIASISKASRSK
jgi:hypothetical protein